MSSIRVINGTIVPDVQTVMAVLSQTVNDLKADASKLERFKTDPRGYLGGLGLNADIQQEVLNEAGWQGVDLAQGCTVTCIATCNGCCVTCWFSAF